MKNDILLQALNSMDSVEYSGGNAVTSSGVDASLAAVRDNPEFVSQIDLQVTVKYVHATLRDTGQVNIVVAPENLPAELKTSLPFYLFGRGDEAGGYANNRSRVPVNPIWGEFDMGIYKSIGGMDNSDKDSALHPDNFAPVESTFSPGSMVHAFSHIVSDSEAYFAYVTVGCKQIAYASLLESTQSDRFVLNMIRYAVSDVSQLAQFEEQLQIINLTMFGKQSNDFISPSSFRAPSNYQDVVIDIPLTLGVDKETSLCSYAAYKTTNLLLSVFIVSQKKLTA